MASGPYYVHDRRERVTATLEQKAKQASGYFVFEAILPADRAVWISVYNVACIRSGNAIPLLGVS